MAESEMSEAGKRLIKAAKEMRRDYGAAPEDINTKAAALCRHLGIGQLARQIIAEALLAERERCAAIADSFPTQILQFWDRPGGPPGNGYRTTTGADIAAAIRKLEPIPAPSREDSPHGRE